MVQIDDVRVPVGREVTMAETKGVRVRLFRAVHAEASKRGLDHDALRDVCRERFSVHSMGELTEGQLESLYRGWTGHGMKRKSALPKRGYAKTTEAAMVSGEDLETLGRAFAARGWGKETQRVFIRRQLGGREQIRTRRDFWKVFSGVRAMNRRDAA
jgi:hypothetical protein